MELQVARLGKPHGIRGEFTVEVFTDHPEGRFIPGAEFATKPAANGPLTVTSARWNKGILLLGFASVADRNRAEELRGTYLFVDTDELEEADDDGWYEHELLGLDVRVGEETVGTVAGLTTMPVQDLLVVKTTDGREVLVPFVEEIVPEIDLEDGYVLLTPPPGLLELNLDEKNDGEAPRGEGED
ncbi:MULTISPECIES: ribosome maturation factor RimM [Arthrobacter]|uniref:Ribosome maturation factor RimM n=2 Tax=Arthrobacter TaxID=1663 RepID=A0ABU9KFC6_9MICC|nr:ribosome maturation factor RimM [Arthrobacter sp. YJM1]MDP5225576.1 ribosome maturation factor RimM [Arthrobacter sp. YJM1]